MTNHMRSFIGGSIIEIIRARTREPSSIHCAQSLSDAIDPGDPAEHLNDGCNALSIYEAVIPDDTAQNIPGGLESRRCRGGPCRPRIRCDRHHPTGRRRHANENRFIHRFTPAAPILMGDDEDAFLQLCREKPGEAEPDLTDRPCPTQHDRGAIKPSASPVGAAHSEFVAALAGHPPRPIPLDADAFDLEDRADHLDKVFGALSVYVTMILDDTAQNVSGGLDLPNTEAVLADLASDVTGTIQRAAEDMAGRVA
jgi:hypothetical protein